MKTITWITPDYFLQVDLPVLLHLKKYFQLKWVVYAQPNSDKAKTAREYAQKHNIDITFFTIKGHRYSPLCYKQYCKQMQILKSLNSDIYYFNIIGFPYLLFAIKRYIPHNKVIMTMHHGKIHKGMQLRHLYKYYLKYLCRQDFHFQYFSESQAKYFSGNKEKCHIIPLALNDFGHSNKIPSPTSITFLSFGHIIETKNIGLLIRAAEEVKKYCKLPFKVRIVGHCRNWEPYQQLIKHPEIFDLSIKSIPDTDIPDLFATTHYLVLPYKSVTQSGPLRIAYGYNTPVIASDLEGFKESIINNVTGLLFKTDDVTSLASLMRNVIENPQTYNIIKSKQKEYINNNISEKVIINKYINMFNNII